MTTSEPAGSRPEPVLPIDQPAPASCSARLMAHLIDLSLLLMLHIAALFIMATGLFPYIAPTIPTLVGTSLFLLVQQSFSLPLGAFLYFTVFHALGGQTPGKLMLGIKVIATGARKEMTLAQSFLRSCGYVLSALPLGAGFLWAVVEKSHLAWHDQLADTMVVSQRNDLTKKKSPHIFARP